MGDAVKSELDETILIRDLMMFNDWLIHRVQGCQTALAIDVHGTFLHYRTDKGASVTIPLEYPDAKSLGVIEDGIEVKETLTPKRLSQIVAGDSIQLLSSEAEWIGRSFKVTVRFRNSAHEYSASWAVE